jgi:hypothetical protein
MAQPFAGWLGWGLTLCVDSSGKVLGERLTMLQRISWCGQCKVHGLCRWGRPKSGCGAQDLLVWLVSRLGKAQIAC